MRSLNTSTCFKSNYLLQYQHLGKLMSLFAIAMASKQIKSANCDTAYEQPYEEIMPKININDY